jgi:GH15 family glucan-1,4-alpha-glucosidase
MSGIKCQQLYLPETNILLTRFLSTDGVAEVTDFMPIKEVGTPEHEHKLIRSVALVHGSISFTLVCRPAFNYARDEHSVDLSGKGATFQHQHFHLNLASPSNSNRMEREA